MPLPPDPIFKFEAACDRCPPCADAQAVAEQVLPATITATDKN